MEKIFNSLGQSLFSELNDGEDLILSFYGENSQFVRFNNASVRQTGLVDDADIGLKFIANGRTCGGGFTVSGNFDTDLKRAKRDNLNSAVDLINQIIGRNTVHIGSQGISRKWQLKREKLSPCYTTKWDDLLRVRC